MISCVYDKTDKGREEIATRKYQIPARMRTLLVLVDGRRPLEWLLSNVAGLGLTQHSVDELLAQQFIRVVPGTEPALPVPAPAAEVQSARARTVEKHAARVAAAAHAPAVAGDDAIASAGPAGPAAGAGPDQDQFRDIYAFYNRSIKSAIGLRGVMLQLKVEKAVGVEELRDLRTAFLQTVIKARGADVAIAMRAELDELLGGAPPNDAVVMPEAGSEKRGALDFFNMSGGAVEY